MREYSVTPCPVLNEAPARLHRLFIDKATAHHRLGMAFQLRHSAKLLSPRLAIPEFLWMIKFRVLNLPQAGGMVSDP